MSFRSVSRSPTISSERPSNKRVGGVDQVDTRVDAKIHQTRCLVEPDGNDLFAKAPLPPNVIVPMVRVETLRPERPSKRYSIGFLPIMLA